MNTTWKITEAFGTEAQVERLTREAIGIASWTGSVGATASESRWDQDTNKTETDASVTVSRV